MDFIFISGGKSREAVYWTPETRAFFTRIADEIEDRPRVTVMLKRKGRLTARPRIFFNHKERHLTIDVAGFEDGIAVRLEGDNKDRALQIPDCREIGARYPRNLRGMVSMPWSTHDRWKEFILAARDSVLNGS